MNKNKIERAIKKKERKQRGVRAWWRINNYKVMRIVLWFIWIPLLIYKRHYDKKREAFIENPHKTKKWIDKVFPKMVYRYCTNSESILIMLGTDYDSFGDFCTEDFANQYVTSRRAGKYFSLLTEDQRKRMIMDYVIEGYKKKLLLCRSDWEETEQKFNWYANCNKDYDQAVVFYADKS